MFLTPEEIAELTGRKVKRLQVEQLRLMGIPFFVNAVGRPIVVRSVLEGKKEAPQRPKWQSNLLRPVKGAKPGDNDLLREVSSLHFKHRNSRPESIPILSLPAFQSSADI